MIKRMPNIVLLGAPGCGKGTLAKHLVKEMGYVHFSTGDMFREIIQTPTELGKKIKAIMDSGSLISDDITNEMIKTYIEKALKENKHFILDGYPRTINQAKYLKSILDIDLAIYLTISLETSVKRISGRVTCPKCGAIFNKYFKPTKVENVCDICGSQLKTRADDNAETAKKRYEVYIQNTEPLINLYKEEKVLVEVDADKESSDKILLEVEQILKK